MDFDLSSRLYRDRPPRGGAVSVTVSVPGVGAAIITVANTGIGVSAAEIPRALAAFEEVDNRTGRRYGGTGLGLRSPACSPWRMAARSQLTAPRRKAPGSSSRDRFGGVDEAFLELDFPGLDLEISRMEPANGRSFSRRMADFRKAGLKGPRPGRYTAKCPRLKIDSHTGSEQAARFCQAAIRLSRSKLVLQRALQ